MLHTDDPDECAVRRECPDLVAPARGDDRQFAPRRQLQVPAEDPGAIQPPHPRARFMGQMGSQPGAQIPLPIPQFHHQGVDVRRAHARQNRTVPHRRHRHDRPQPDGGLGLPLQAGGADESPVRAVDGHAQRESPGHDRVARQPLDIHQATVLARSLAHSPHGGQMRARRAVEDPQLHRAVVRHDDSPVAQSRRADGMLKQVGLLAIRGADRHGRLRSDPPAPAASPPAGARFR